MPGQHANTTDILKRCDALGFAASGVCRAEPSAKGQSFREWLDRGEHGSMAWLAERIDMRLDPRTLMPGCRSIIVVGDLYAERPREQHADTTQPHVGRIARYARGRDYHRVIKRRLHTLADALRAEYPDAMFRATVDSAPIMEREHAARAGLGWTGKHTLTIHPKIGSYTLLGCLLTTLDIEPSTQRPAADHCGTCTRCIDACPTDAITPYSVNASRCISYLTIERKDAIDPAFHAAIGDWLFGCDICQEVCPHNSPRDAGQDAGPHAHPDYAPRYAGFDLLEMLSWTEQDRRTRLAGTPVTRASLPMLKRNAIIVAGNSPAMLPGPQHNHKLNERITAIAADESEDPVVRQTARDVLSRLNQRP